MYVGKSDEVEIRNSDERQPSVNSSDNNSNLRASKQSDMLSGDANGGFFEICKQHSEEPVIKLGGLRHGPLYIEEWFRGIKETSKVSEPVAPSSSSASPPSSLSTSQFSPSSPSPLSSSPSQLSSSSSLSLWSSPSSFSSCSSWVSGTSNTNRGHEGATSSSSRVRGTYNTNRSHQGATVGSFYRVDDPPQHGAAVAGVSPRPMDRQHRGTGLQDQWTDSTVGQAVRSDHDVLDLAQGLFWEYQGI